MEYTQLGIEERCAIASLQAEGTSIREIARRLGRAASTIAREIPRNSSRTGGYRPSVAHGRAAGRRWTGSRLERDGTLREAVLGGLSAGVSPEAVAARLAMVVGHPVISAESIYRFIYRQIDRHKDYRWRHYLPRGKAKRGRRGRKGGSSVTFIPHRRPVAERPSVVADRQQCGHWEADTMQFGRSGPVALMLQERHSRFLLAARLPSKAAATPAAALTALLAPFPAAVRRTVTFDNGSEFVHHDALHSLGIETFFCDTYAPWQKGGVENAIGRQRRFLPRKTKIEEVPDAQFAAIMDAYNHIPRKCLGYHTPAAVFAVHLLHFKCESSFLPSQERRERGRRHDERGAQA